MADEMFRAPLNRGMRSLDKSKFQKTVPIKAARVCDKKNIAQIQTKLFQSKDVLRVPRLSAVHPDPDSARASTGDKCILLNPFKTSANSAEAEPDVEGSPTVRELVQQGLVSVIPYQLHLDYDYWTFHDIMSAILPENELDEIPGGFALAGHVAHMNLREPYIQYKHLIAKILLDKNPNVRTVINKIDDVGEQSEYRTFKYEVLAGPDDLNVMVTTLNCKFKFDWSKVYWNTRLEREHERMVAKFAPGEAVCDVMAGVGPFAVPAGKQRVFVYANDLNPDCYTSLLDAIKRNKVNDYVLPFNDDGRKFIRTATAELARSRRTARIPIRTPKSKKGAEQAFEEIEWPRVFSHYVMNLPASALTFLPSFIGLYPPDVRASLPANFVLPQVHVYCFSGKPTNTDADASNEICKIISEQLQHEMHPGSIKEDGGVEIWDVRDVAPKKRMYCASFQLPEAVAFRDVESKT